MITVHDMYNVGGFPLYACLLVCFRFGLIASYTAFQVGSHLLLTSYMYVLICMPPPV